MADSIADRHEALIKRHFRIIGGYTEVGELVEPWVAKDSKALDKWEPVAFIASITSNGVQEHPEPENPGIKAVMAVSIPKAILERSTPFLAGANFNIWWTNFSRTDYESTLVMEPGDDSVYLICTALGMPMIVGKLVQSRVQSKFIEACQVLSSQLS